jgi:hypothetical protein
MFTQKDFMDLYKAQELYKSAEVSGYTAVTISATPPCKHNNGWYHSIPARFFGRRRVFVCTDCGDILTPNKKEEV